jgi:DNA-binding MarR family transcriptional regulator
MEPTGSAYTPEDIRELFVRRELAARRQRRAVTKQLGLEDTEAEALAHLARTGGMTPSQLGELLGMTSGGVTALTQRLERAGRISRRPHPTDKRSRLLEAASETIEQARAHYKDLIAEMDRVAERLADPERDAIGRYLEQLVLINERHADRAEAAASARDDAEPPEPVELWA